MGLAICLSHFISLGQQAKIDSLLTHLKTDKNDTTKVNRLNDLCRGYVDIGEQDKGLPYGIEALQLAKIVPVEKKSGWPKGIAQSYNNIGTVYYNQGNYDNALENHFAAIKIREEYGDKKGLENYFVSLKLREDIKDRKGVAQS